jgi:Domain of unknown function (DUF4157)
MGKCANEPSRKADTASGRGATARSGAGQQLPRLHGNLRTSGQMLDGPTRVLMEARLNHDFSRVRVHTGASAAESANAIGAQAYTARPNIVFASGLYRPDLPAGRALIAHELMHIVQQEQGRADGIQRRPPTGDLDDPMEREAREKERDIGRPRHGSTPTRQEFLQSVIPPPRPRAELDQPALDIIRDAQDGKRDLGVRAVSAVWAIIHSYFSDQASKVSVVRYDENDPGLTTSYKGTGANATGEISVGYFVENTTRDGLARRVIQVAHELEHVDQIRSGMGGQAHKHEREFLAFYHEALATEVAHTGLVSHSTRVSLIDAALGHFNCFDAALKKQHDAKQQELLAKRATEIQAGGRGPATPPTACPSP